MEEQSKSGLVRWNSIKLVLVGKENVGKSTIRISFQNKAQPAQNISTGSTFFVFGFNKNIIDGLTIEPLNMNNLSFTVFDFGGQQIFHGTHQFFLSSRSLYLITFNACDMEFPSIDFWVRQVAASAGSLISPTILVGTHADELEPAERESIKKQIDAKFKHRPQVMVISYFTLML